MDENKNQNSNANLGENVNQNIGDDLKNETINTVKDVKDTVKNINFKEEAKNGQSYLSELCKNPAEKIEDIANDTENRHFKSAILAIIIWMVIALIEAISIYNVSFEYFMKNIFNIILLIITPIISILVLSVLVMIFNKENKKSLNTIITTVTTAKLPVILGDLIGLLYIVSSKSTTITTPIANFLHVISTILLFFGIKSLYGTEDNNKSIKEFALVMAGFYIVRFVLTYLNISML